MGEKVQYVTYEQFDPWSDHPETILSNVKKKCLQILWKFD